MRMETRLKARAKLNEELGEMQDYAGLTKRSSRGRLSRTKSFRSLKKSAIAPVATRVVIVFGEPVPPVVTFCAPILNDCSKSDHADLGSANTTYQECYGCVRRPIIVIEELMSVVSV